MGVTKKIEHVDVSRIEMLPQQFINTAKRKLLIHIWIQRQLKLPMPVKQKHTRRKRKRNRRRHAGSFLPFFCQSKHPFLHVKSANTLPLAIFYRENPDSGIMQQVHRAGMKKIDLHPFFNVITLCTYGIKKNALLFYIFLILRNLFLLPLQFRGHETELIAEGF